MCCAVLSHSVLSDSLWLYGLKPARLLCPWGFSRQEYWSGLSCPPPRELPNPGIEPRSSALQADSLPTEPPRKPKNTGVGTYPFSSRSSRPRNRTGVSCIAGGFFTSWATREAQEYWSGYLSLLQWIFLTQESNWGLLYCRWIIYQLGYQGSPKSTTLQ